MACAGTARGLRRLSLARGIRDSGGGSFCWEESGKAGTRWLAGRAVLCVAMGKGEDMSKWIWYVKSRADASCNTLRLSGPCVA